MPESLPGGAGSGAATSDLATSRVDRDALRRAVAARVLALPGVLRIEPTLLSAVKSLREVGDPADDVRVTVRGALVDVVIHVAVRSDHQARLLAHRLRAEIDAVVADCGGSLGHVQVAVLTIEPV